LIFYQILEREASLFKTFRRWFCW